MINALNATSKLKHYYTWIIKLSNYYTQICFSIRSNNSDIFLHWNRTSYNIKHVIFKLIYYHLNLFLFLVKDIIMPRLNYWTSFSYIHYFYLSWLQRISKHFHYFLGQHCYIDKYSYNFQLFSYIWRWGLFHLLNHSGCNVIFIYL